MVDDSADNLHQAKALGMKTVWYGEKAHPLPFADGIAKICRVCLNFAQNSREVLKKQVQYTVLPTLHGIADI